MLSITLLCLLGADPADDPLDAEVRSAVERALPVLEREGVEWMETQDCNSCHRVPFLIWSHHEASLKGIQVDQAKLDEWTQWALDDTFEDRYWFRFRPRSFADLKADGLPEEFLETLRNTQPTADMTFVTESEFVAAWEKALPAEVFVKHRDALLRRAASPNNGGAPDTMSQLILARAPLDISPEMREKYDALRSLLLEWQEPDGFWMGGGQQPSQRRPRTEIHEATTMWTVLALSALDGEGGPSADARAKALAWLRGGEPGVSNETLLLRTLIEHQFGSPERADELLRQILSEQHADGGWSWVRENDAGDAFATGQTLYALGRLGKGGDDAAVKKGREYLLSTQTDDGSWSVSAPEITTVTGDALEEVRGGYHYWGTAWAVIGLSRTLPDRPSTQP